MAKPQCSRPFQKRQRLNKHQQLQISKRRSQTPSLTYRELASWAKDTFKLATSPSKKAVANAIKSGLTNHLTPDCLARKKARPPFQLALDQCVVEFITVCEAFQLSLTGEMIITQAQLLAQRLQLPANAQPRFGWSWLRHLQQRYGIRWRKAHGESGAVDLKAVESEVRRLRGIINTYACQDVFNMDETGFFYDNVPRGSMCINDPPSLKQNKSRITLAVCTNVTGSNKVSLLFLGKSVQPRWIKGKPSDVDYVATKKAWMTADAFQSWAMDFNEKMRAQGRSVLLLIDNASSHDIGDVQLSNVRLEKLPPNTTSKLQPLDQGIIYCIKRDVLRKKMHAALDKMDDGDANPYKVGMLQGIKWCAEAWRDLPAKTIEHCWLHSGLICKTDMSFIL